MILLINGKEIELQDNQVTYNRTAFDPDSPSFRRIDYSGDVRIPFTNNNHRVMRSAYDIGSKGKDNKIYADAIVKNENTIINAKAKYKGIRVSKRDRYYTIQILDRSKELLDYLDQNINELDLSDYDFEMSAANIQARKGIDNLISFPLVKMDIQDNYYTIDNANYQYARPFLLIKYILEKAFSDKNYTLIYEDQMMNNLALTMNHSRLYATSFLKNYTDEEITASGLLDYTAFDFDHNVTVTQFTVDSSATPTIFRLKGDVILTGACTIQIEQTTGDQLIQKFYIDESDTEIDITSEEIDGTVQIRIIPEGTITFLDVDVYTLVEGENISNDFEDYYFKVHDNLPDVTIIDLFRAYLLLTYSYIDSDQYKNEIGLRLLRKGLVKDWSDKFIEDTEEIEEIPNAYKVSRFVYDNDDFVSKNFGFYQFKIFDQRIEDLGDLVTIPFSASSEIEITIAFNDYDVCYMPVYDNSVRENDLNIRLVYLEDGGVNLSNQYISKFSPIDFKSLAPVNYKDYISSLKDYARVKADFFLSQEDVISWRPTDVIYVKHFHSLFRVIEIGNFVKGMQTQVELYRI